MATSSATSGPAQGLAASIIVPIRNGADYLAECLASIERQTLDGFEVLCVDDASTDESAAIVAAFAARDSRFCLFSLPENKGAAAARNFGMDRAAGDYLAFIDCDDFYPSDSTLEALVSAARSSGAAIAGGSYSEFDMVLGEVRTDFSFDAHLDACFTFRAEGMVDYCDWQGDYGFQRFVFSRALLQEAGIRFPEISRHEDPVFLVRAMLAAGRFYALPEVAYRYRVGHRDGVIRESGLREAIDAICEIIEISAREDLPVLRGFQYDLLRWYCLEAPIWREYGSWAEIGQIARRQAGESLRLRLGNLSQLAKK